MKKLILLLSLVAVVAFSATGLQVESAIGGYVDSSGNPLENGTVDFYVNDGSSTHKEVYSNSSMTSVISQPIVLNNAGIPTNLGQTTPVFGNGTYRMVVKDSTGTIVYNISGLSYQGTVDFGGIYTDIASSYGTTDTALSKALVAVSATSSYTFLFKSGTYTCSTPHTFPSNVTLKFMQGAKLNISYSPNINGFIDAGAYQIFTGTATPVINTANNPIILDSWYGRITGISNIQNIQSITITSNSIIVSQSLTTKATISSAAITTLNIASKTNVTGNIDVAGNIFITGNVTANLLAVTSIGTDGNTALKMKVVSAAIDGASGTATIAHGLSIGNIRGVSLPVYSDANYYTSSFGYSAGSITATNIVVGWIDNAGGSSPGCNVYVTIFYI